MLSRVELARKVGLMSQISQLYFPILFMILYP